LIQRHQLYAERVQHLNGTPHVAKRLGVPASG
jgi:hypothetical protein